MVLARILPLLSLIVMLSSLHAAHADESLCRRVSEQILAFDPPAGLKDPWRSPVLALDLASNGILHISKRKSLPKKEALGRLQAEFRATPALMSAATTLSDFSEYVDLYRFGHSPLHAVIVVEGSAGCQRFVFFAAKPDGRADVIAAPPVVQNVKEGSMMFCGGIGSEGWIGEVGGDPAFVVEEGTDQDEKIDITPWQKGNWQEECQIAVHFKADFRIAERFCKDVDCASVSEQALALTMQFDKDPKTVGFDQSEKAQGLKQRAEDQLSGQRELPTFGAQAKQAATTFSEDSILLPVVRGDEIYVGHLGHATIGWRVYTDYLFALYRLSGSQLDPVAGIYIEKTRGKPVEATTK